MDTLGKLSMSDFQICLNLELVDYHPLNLEAHIIVGDIEVERFALQSVTMDTWSSRTVASLAANVADFRLAISGTIQELHQALGYVEISSVDLFGRCLSFEDVYITSAQLDSGNIQAMQIQFCYTYSICEFIQRLEFTSSPESTFTPDVIDSIQEVFIMFSEPVILSDKSALKFIQKAISEMHVSKHDMRPGYLSKMVQLFDQKYKSTSDISYLHNAVETLACMSITFQPDHDKLPPQLTKQEESIREWFDWWQNNGGIGSDQITDILEAALQHIPETFLGHSRPLSVAAWYLQQIDPKLSDRAIANYEAAQANPHMKPDCEVPRSLKNALNRPIRLFGDVEGLGQASQVLSLHKPPSYDPDHGAPWWVWIQRSLRHLNPGGMTAVVLLEEMAQVPTLSNFKKELGLLAFELYPHPTTWLEQGLFWNSPDTPRPLHTFGQGITPAFYDAIVEMTQSVGLVKSFVPQLHAFIEGLVLHIRFLVYNDLDDLDNSIQLGLGEQFSSQHLSSFITPAHLEALYGNPEIRWLLAIRYMTRYRVKGDVSDLKQALPIFMNCAKFRISVSIGPQLSAATWWGIVATQLGERDLAMAGYIKALNTLPEVPWIGLPLEERHKQLYYNESLAPLASAAALEFGDPYRAIEWLEQGRSVIWNQLLQLRVTTEGLEKVDPDLAKRFASVCAELQADKAGGLLNAEDRNEEFLSRAAQVAEICYPLVSEREDLINNIRQLPGFETFLLPHTMDRLREAAQHGPIVILNASRYPDKCDALVLLSDLEEVIHIPLHNMPHSRASALQRQFASLIRTSGRSLEIEESRYGGVLSKMKAKKGHHHPKVQTIDTTFSEILKELWYSVVHPVLDGLTLMNIGCVDDYAEPNISNLFRIWWCPIGPFACLPLHAAGDYSRRGHQVFNYIISSYTPTVSALLNQRKEPSAHMMDQTRLLAVVQSASDTSFPLPGTREELRLIQSRIDNTKTKIKLDVLCEDDASREMVLDKVQQANWVHFACHGVQDVTNPTNSALLLAKGSRLRLDDLIKLSLPNAQLAFLSACQTATGVSTMPDEAIHLAAGMLLAGFSGVIATLWSIGDSDAPRVADDVYARLLGGEGESRVPDASEAAFALHCAVDKLRKGYSNTSFMNWVPYVHIGI